MSGPWGSARSRDGFAALRGALRGTLILGVLAGAGNAVAAKVTVAQQIADSGYTPLIDDPAYRFGEGPRVLVDGAHQNFHQADERFRPFAELLRADGYRVSANAAPFDSAMLARTDILVIANALHPDNQGDWQLPNPSAFTAEEQRAVWRWVDAGGALLLIADHMPFPGAAAELAGGFGILFNNGFALLSGHRPPDMFRRGEGTLQDHLITRAHGGVDSVASFTGQAFLVPGNARPLMTLPEGFRSLMPRVAWQFSETTPSHDVAGWCQGAVLQVGQGRVAVFGEAAMFTSQLAGPQQLPVGLASPQAAGNERFIRNVLRWLDGSLEEN